MWIMEDDVRKTFITRELMVIKGKKKNKKKYFSFIKRIAQR